MRRRGKHAIREFYQITVTVTLGLQNSRGMYDHEMARSVFTSGAGSSENLPKTRATLHVAVYLTTAALRIGGLMSVASEK